MTDGALPFPIRGFMPKTNVINHMRIDLDLHEMLTHMLSFTHVHSSSSASDGSTLKLDIAKRLYEVGGHAVREAELTVPPLAQDMKAGDFVFQQRSNDWTRSAALRVSAPAGSTQLVVEYTSYQRPCFGGATRKRTTTGAYDVELEVSAHCLDAESPLYTRDPSNLGGNAVPQTDVIGNPLVVKHKFMTLAELSTTADHRMKGETGFELGRAYYGSGDYAYLFIMNTFDENIGRPLVDYRKVGHSVGSDIVRKIIVFMTIHQEVVHQLFKAVELCDDVNESDCKGEDCEDSAMHAWEKAAAYYAGSSWEDRGSSIFLDGSAQDMCRVFGTCDNKGDALANKWIYKRFKAGQDLLAQGDCDRLSVEREKIVQQMHVPIVQHLLRTAFALATESNVHRDEAHGVFFAKLIQPKVQKCDPQTANLITENLILEKPCDDGKTCDEPMSSGFGSFKRAVETLYPCLGIRCLDIGGILAKEQLTAPGKDVKYVSEGEPCPDPNHNSVDILDEQPPPTANHAEQVDMMIGYMTIVAMMVMP